MHTREDYHHLALRVQLLQIQDGSPLGRTLDFLTLLNNKLSFSVYQH